MEPALFSAANMFDCEDVEQEEEAFVDRDHNFPGLVLHVREFLFHQVNANLLWPGTTIFAKWLVQHEELLNGRRVLELGSGTGALAIFLKIKFGLDITTSDYDDVEIQNNINTNCVSNGLATLPHIRHTWGEPFPCTKPDWDLLIASDILLYVKQYPNLIRTISFLLKGYEMGSQQISRQEPVGAVPPTKETHNVEKQEPESAQTEFSGTVDQEVSNASILIESQTSSIHLHKTSTKQPCFDDDHPGIDKQAPSSSVEYSIAQAVVLPRPCFLMSWRRRIPKQNEALFFEGCKSAGFVVNDFGSRVYCIHQSL